MSVNAAEVAEIGLLGCRIYTSKVIAEIDRQFEELERVL